MQNLNLYIKQLKLNCKNAMEEKVIANMMFMMIMITQEEDDTKGQYTMIMMNIECKTNLKCMIMIDFMEHTKIIEI